MMKRRAKVDYARWVFVLPALLVVGILLIYPIFSIPWAFPSIVIALSWKWILNGVSGFIPNILVQLGICNELPQFLSDNSFVFLTLIFIHYIVEMM